MELRAPVKGIFFAADWMLYYKASQKWLIADKFDMGDYSPFDDIISTLKNLKGRYTLGVVSNTWQSVKRLKSHGIYDYFDTKTFGCFLGARMPDERVYRHALEQMKLPPEQTVFIGDVAKNLEGAAKCGIQPILIAAKPDPENNDKYPSIKKLPELLELLPE